MKSCFPVSLPKWLLPWSFQQSAKSNQTWRWRRWNFFLWSEALVLHQAERPAAVFYPRVDGKTTMEWRVVSRFKNAGFSNVMLVSRGVNPKKRSKDANLDGERCCFPVLFWLIIMIDWCKHCKRWEISADFWDVKVSCLTVRSAYLSSTNGTFHLIAPSQSSPQINRNKQKGVEVSCQIRFATQVSSSHSHTLGL